MTKYTVHILFFLLALGQVLGENAVQKFLKDVKKASKEIEEEAAEAKIAYKDAVTQVNDVHYEMAQRVKRMNGLYDRALKAVDDAPKRCRKNVKSTLTVLKSGGVGNFLTCSKLIEAGKDIGEVGLTTVDVIFDVIDIGRDVSLGFSGCLDSWWPWKIVECWYDRITTTYDDIKRTISNIKSYATDIEDYAHNASVLIKYCWSGSSAEADVLAAMTPLHDCAQQPLSKQLYKL